jgi:simple sugar transport system permease protein
MSTPEPAPPAALGRFDIRRLPAVPAIGRGPLRFAVSLVIALIGFGVVVAIQKENPVAVYRDIIDSTVRSKYGFSEVLVRMIPLLLCALAVAIPARVGLVNVGGEGQLYIGAWAASWVALTFTSLDRPLLLPLMFAFAAAGGAAWAAVPAFLRARGWLNETISTLLLNYVAILFVQYFVFGPWKDPLSANFPQSKPFPAGAILPALGDYRVHLGLVFGLVAVAAMFAILRYTRWGYEIRAIGGNPEAAHRNGIPVAGYLVGMLVLGGAMAALAGFGEVSAIQGRLRPSVSPGFGFIGFLAAWLAGHNPLAIVVITFVLAVLTAGGDSLQISHGLPFASVNLLMALTLFSVLAFRGGKRAVAA